jgi:hypothetical protein
MEGFINNLIVCIFVSPRDEYCGDCNMITLINGKGEHLTFVQSESDLDLTLSTCGEFGMLREHNSGHDCVIKKEHIQEVIDLIRKWKQTDEIEKVTPDSDKRKVIEEAYTLLTDIQERDWDLNDQDNWDNMETSICHIIKYLEKGE